MVRVLVVDDHQLVRSGLCHMLDTVNGIDVVDQAESGERALEILQQTAVDVVLMDVRMPGMGGLEATRRASRLQPTLKVVAVSVYDEDPFPTKLLEAGAAGYVSKGAAIDEVVKAIRAVHSGQRYLSSAIAQEMALQPYRKAGAKNPFAELSHREMQITLMVVNCKKVHDISEELSLSPKTVNSYRYRIFEKLSVSSDVELTHLALRHGVLDTELPLPA